MNLSRKAINFDLSTEALKKIFGKNTAQTYNNVKEFMLENDFEHRQYSGYASIFSMNDKELAKIIKRLNKKFTWLSECIQEFDVTDIGEQYSLKYIFENDKKLSSKKELTILKEKTQKLPQK